MTPAKAQRAVKRAAKLVSKKPAAMTTQIDKKIKRSSVQFDADCALELAPYLREASVKHAGMSPLDVMLKVMHELVAAAEQVGSAPLGQTGDLFGDGVMNESRIKLLNMAAAVGRNVAPYVHPRLSAIEHTGKDGTPLQNGVLLMPSVLSLEAWELAAGAAGSIEAAGSIDAAGSIEAIDSNSKQVGEQVGKQVAKPVEQVEKVKLVRQTKFDQN